MADCLQQVGDVVVVEAVVGVAAGAADGDEAPLAQQAQLVRGGARRQPCQLDKLLDRPLSVNIAQSRRSRLPVPKARIDSANDSASAALSGRAAVRCSSGRGTT